MISMNTYTGDGIAMTMMDDIEVQVREGEGGG
jgi:hypothetical protein